MANDADSTVHAAENLFEAFRSAARRHSDSLAVASAGDDVSAYTYAEALEVVERLAVGLQKAHPQVTEIGLLSENRPEWPLAYLAILAAGKTVVPLDPNLKQNELAELIGNADLQALFVSERFEKDADALRGSRELAVISFNTDSPRSWKNHLSEGELTVQVPGDTTAALIYTSGTTGKPKAVMLTHRNLLSNLVSIQAGLQFNHEDVFLSILPLHHTFEATCGFLTPLLNGCKVVYARSLKSKEILEDIGDHGVTVMCGVPLLFEKMHKTVRGGVTKAAVHRRALFRLMYSLSALGWRLGRRWGKPLFSGLRGNAGLGKVRMFVSGGAALPPEVARFFNLLGFDFLQGYGMTECSPVISVNRPGDIEFGSVGPILNGIEARIHEPDSSGIGELVIRGGNVTPGYKDDPENTAALIRDGWLHTGDLAHIKRNHLWITGRAKNLIVSAAGKNIYPEELEEKLVASDYVLEVLVIGRPKGGKQGEEVHAILVPDLEQFEVEFGMESGKPDMSKVEQVIKDEVAKLNASVADYKRISSHRVQLDELEKTSSRKVKRFVYQRTTER